MNYRKYNPKKDKKAVHRIWKECGWLEGDDYKPMDILIESSKTVVADIRGQPECLALSIPGNILYQDKKLKFSGIAGVTTSLVARKQKLAGCLTAEVIALDAMDGALVSGLGMFEQGYYNNLGFGTGGYEYLANFSPSTLNTGIKPRVPHRLEYKDWKKIYESRLKRMRVHGSLNFDGAHQTRAELKWEKSGCGFGYFDENGELTHYFWMDGKGKGEGPFHIWWMVYRNYEQFLELMALIQSFGEQVRLITMVEPPNVQIQDFLTKPFYHRSITKQSKFQNIIQATAWWQLRILDLNGCLRHTHLDGDDVRFNLVLDDPIEKFLDSDNKWKGLSGEYIVTLGAKSSAKKGSERNLPTMKASVGAFTRMWMGVLPASILTVSDELSAPQKLLKALDGVINLPDPKMDWGF